LALEPRVLSAGTSRAWTQLVGDKIDIDIELEAVRTAAQNVA
jgi:hypothetical protein